MQGTRVQALVREDPICRRAAEPMRHNYWTPRATTTEPHVPRAHAPKQEQPPQWEARAPQLKAQRSQK